MIADFMAIFRSHAPAVEALIERFERNVKTRFDAVFVQNRQPAIELRRTRVIE